MKKLLGIIIVLFFITSCSEQVATKKTTKEVKAEVEDIYKKVNAKIKSDPNNGKWYIERGRLAMNNNDAELAFADFERAKNIDSLYTDVWVYAGQLNVRTNHFEKAQKDFERAIQLDDKNKEAYCELAKVHLHLRDLQQALINANKAIKVDEQYYLPYYIKGSVYLANGDTAKAVSGMQTAIELNPDFYSGYIHIGSLYETVKNDLALDYFNSAIAVKPKKIEPYYFKAMFLQNTQRVDEAYEVYNQILDLDSTYLFAHYNQGYLCLTNYQDYNLGIEKFSKVIELDKKHFASYYNRGLCHEKMKQFTKAQADYKLALSIKPDYDRAAKGLSRVMAN